MKKFNWKNTYTPIICILDHLVKQILIMLFWFTKPPHTNIQY